MHDSGLRSKLLFLLSFLIILAALAYRRPDAFMDPQFHAEEGKYFFADAYHEGACSVFNTLNGYYHLLPRLIMVFIEDLAIPYAFLPAVYFASVLLLYFLILGFIRNKLPFSVPGKFFAGTCIFLLPLGHEILLNMTNIQWFTALVIFLVFFGKESERKWKSFLESGFLLLACLTGPFSLLMLPLISIRLFFEWRDQELSRWRFFNFLILLVSASLTAFSLYAYGSVSRTDDLTVAGEFGALRYIFYQFSYPLMIGWIYASPAALFIPGSIIASGLFFVFFYRCLKHKKSFASWLCAFSLLFTVVTLLSYKEDPGALSPQYVAIRNFFLPSVFLCWALISVYHTARTFSFVSLILCSWFFLQTILFIGPSSFMDMSWKSHVKRINNFKHDTVMIPVNPPGWFIELDHEKMWKNKGSASKDPEKIIK